MSKGVAIIAGYGTGISQAVATKLGKEGFKVALISRTQAKLDAAAAELGGSGIVAKGYAADLADGAAVKAAFEKVKAELGPLTIVFWNPYGAAAGLLTASQAQLVHEFNTTTAGLVAAVQAAYEDLKAQAGKSAVLVTGGGLSLESDQTTELAIQWGAVTLATAKAAQRKLVHILNKQLGKDGIYAVEVTVLGAVRGTPFDATGDSKLTAELVADTFWGLYTKRDPSVWSAPLTSP